MVRYFFGAYDPIDNAISVLKSRELVAITGRKSGGRIIETNFPIFPKAFQVCEGALKSAPVLQWYRDRAKIVCDVAGEATGGALKERQYKRSQYAGTELGYQIPSITDVVRQRLDAIKRKDK